MNILAIETSADESAVSVVQATGTFPDATYSVRGNALRSQVELHEQYGGIFPMMAKREHAKALTPLLQVALDEAELLAPATTDPTELAPALAHLQEREPELQAALTAFLTSHERPDIDLITVTAGPGLEPTLWVGINFARALAQAWNIPVVPVNHMEGHLLVSIFDVERDDQLSAINFPAIALLISGGHTELILMRDWSSYKKIGQTRDDAVGEAFDKVARMLGLPYPGGPEISARAKLARANDQPPYGDPLPRPMLTSGDLDFSFSGLKTAVRYKIQDTELDEQDVAALARDFEDTIADVLLAKTGAAIADYGAQTLIVGGGVSANQHIKRAFETTFLNSHPDLAVYFPGPGMSTDNSVMIALAGHAHSHTAIAPAAANTIRATGTRALA